MSQDPRFELAEVFAEVARSLEAENDKAATLQRICSLLVESVGGAQYAGVSLLEDGRMESLASSDDVPRTIDAIQDELQEGPCRDAIRRNETVLVASLRHDGRWKNFAGRAHRASGVEAILSVPLGDSDSALGALNLYSKTPDAFSDDDVHVASIFAVHAAVAVFSLRRDEQFEQALATRDVIGRAKGILQARTGKSDDEVFQMLRQASQRMNVRLRDVAERVTRGDQASTAERDAGDGASEQ